MKGLIFVTFTKAFWSIRLNFSLHNSANGHDIATDAGVNKIIFNLCLNGLWHFSRIYIVDIIFDLLYLEPLVKRSPGSMLLWIENSAPTINIDAPIWRLPLSINEANNDLGLALMTSELDGFDQDFDR